MKKSDYLLYVLDRLQPHGQITSRAMFGGYGIYYNSLIIGIIAEDQLYFKTDELTRPDFEVIESKPFTYHGKGKTYEMSYWHIPDSILEDADELALWLEKAYHTSLRSQKVKKTKPLSR